MNQLFADYEFISPSDKPALLALSSMEALANVQTIVLECGYKIHVASNHEDFSKRFTALNYHLVVVEELFAAGSEAENTTLRSLQSMAMARRRHTVLVLVSDRFQTLNPMHAFQQSVHAVVNKADLSSLGGIITKAVADNDLFLHSYREVQTAMAQGKI
ncbi:MAG: hypothetical protein HZA92_10155 [Verrucomicrobia bacterium]|nr:hypothetical protein [Verrucomicrobiota bacterium]